MSEERVVAFALLLKEGIYKKFRLPDVKEAIIIEDCRFKKFKHLLVNLRCYEESILKVLSTDRVDKINSCNSKTAALMFAGDVLSRFAMNYIFSLPMESLEYEVSSSGKPKLKNHDGIYFNLSHSTNALICVVSNEIVGIDIQCMKEINFKPLIKRFFSDKERDIMIDSDYNKHDFFKIWTKKESYIKYSGRKISNGIKNLDYNDCEFIDFCLFDEYEACICQKRKNFKNIIV